MTNAPCEIVPFDGSPADAEALRTLVTVCGLDGGQPADPARFMALPTAQVWLARGGDGIVGFAATFESRTLAGHRLEVDLLGVHPEQHGQGIGTALVRRAVEGWAGAARALIHVGNVASERAFAHAGFAPEADVRELSLLAPPSEPARSKVASACHVVQRLCAGYTDYAELEQSPRSTCVICEICGSLSDPQEQSNFQGDKAPASFFELLPVTTLTYRGAWVEAVKADRNRLGIWRALAAGATAWAAERRLDMVGALPALSQSRCRQALAEAGYATEGHYRFFLRHGTGEV